MTLFGRGRSFDPTNIRAALAAATAVCLHIERQKRGASERERCAAGAEVFELRPRVHEMEA